MTCPIGITAAGSSICQESPMSRALVHAGGPGALTSWPSPSYKAVALSLHTYPSAWACWVQAVHWKNSKDTMLDTPVTCYYPLSEATRHLYLSLKRMTKLVGCSLTAAATSLVHMHRKPAENNAKKLTFSDKTSELNDYFHTQAYGARLQALPTFLLALSHHIIAKLPPRQVRSLIGACLTKMKAMMMRSLKARKTKTRIYRL